MWLLLRRPSLYKYNEKCRRLAGGKAEKRKPGHRPPGKQRERQTTKLHLFDSCWKNKKLCGKEKRKQLVLRAKHFSHSKIQYIGEL